MCSISTHTRVLPCGGLHEQSTFDDESLVLLSKYMHSNAQDRKES